MKKTEPYIFITLIFIGFSLNANTAETEAAQASPSWTRDIESLKQGAEKVVSIKAQFTQKKTLKILAKPLVSKGVFYYSSPASVRWEYREPMKSVMLTHKGKIRRFSYQGDQYIEDSGAKLEAMRLVMEEITAWLAGRFDKNPMFLPKLIPGSTAKIELLPKEEAMRGFIERIELTLSAQPGVIKSVEVFESKDSSTLIEFINPEINVPIAEETFTELKAKEP